MTQPEPPQTHADHDRRAQLMARLWDLKQAIEEHPEAVENVGIIHFNALLRDPRRRQRLIKYALLAHDPVICTLAKEIEAINVDGSLIGGQELAGDDHETILAPGQPTRSRSTAAAVMAPAGQTARSSLFKWLTVSIVIVVLALLAWQIERRYLADTLVVKGAIDRDTTWTDAREYHLVGKVFVDRDAILTITPGTVIKGQPGAALIVTRRARIDARGIPERPVVFTSDRPPGSRKPGDWGGVVLLGNAPVNTRPGRIEGLTDDDIRGAFGGLDPTDSCGTLEYVRIEFAGHEVSANNELNGLTLGGCGAGTVIRYVQVHRGLDDGVELFGGSANLKYLVISQSGDDGLDWDRGWTGVGQFIVIQQAAEQGDNNIEADNDKSDHDAKPRSRPILANVTLVGSGNPLVAQRGLVLRCGTGGDFRNMIISGYTKEVFDIRDLATAREAERGSLTMQGVVVGPPQASGVYFEAEAGEQDDDGQFDEQAFSQRQKIIFLKTEVLTPKAQDPTRPNFTPVDQEVLTTAAVPLPQGEFWDEAANYIGAVRPGSKGSWLDRWTAFPAN